MAAFDSAAFDSTNAFDTDAFDFGAITASTRSRTGRNRARGALFAILLLLAVGCTTTTTEVVKCEVKAYAHTEAGGVVVVDSLEYLNCDDPQYNGIRIPTVRS